MIYKTSSNKSTKMTSFIDSFKKLLIFKGDLFIIFFTMKNCKRQKETLNRKNDQQDKIKTYTIMTETFSRLLCLGNALK